MTEPFCGLILEIIAVLKYGKPREIRESLSPLRTNANQTVKGRCSFFALPEMQSYAIGAGNGITKISHKKSEVNEFNLEPQ